ncbi:tail protein X [Psychrobacter lutiphocae]|uniref:tail protein X n=1 Tax=Psychrobacter lutiphocae TaxID=540500 RepID=UPI000362AE31|nr:tail protein X [Psychrobacter lutiphocae]
MNTVSNHGYLQHIASAGDRWDSLSYQYYGDATAYEQIIIANKHLPITATLIAGQIVFIPIIQKPAPAVQIPAWLKADNDELIDEVPSD